MINRQLSSLFEVFLIGAVVSGCSAAIGLVEPKPYFDKSKVENVEVGAIKVVLGKRIQDEFTMESASFRDIAVTQYRNSIGRGLKSALSEAFTDVQMVSDESVSGLVLSVLRFEPKPIKVRNQKVGEYTNVYELRFDIHYEALLLKDGAKISRASGKAEGEETSTQVVDNPILMTNAMEVAIAQLLGEIFSSTDE